MISLTQKQIILLTILFFIIISLILFYFLYLQKSNQSIYDLEEQNILENVSSLDEISPASEDTNENNIIVHIAGCVKYPGIVSLKEGDRISDAINVAGGLTEFASIKNVNLAYVLEDGQKIYIPSNDEILDPNFSQEIITQEAGDQILVDSSSSSSSITATSNPIINLNTATQTELETIPGIGPSLALKIIDYRKENGNFTTKEDIKNVSGIGESKYESMKDFICVK